MKITRRSLLRLAGLGAMGIFVPACREMFKQILFSPDASEGEVRSVSGNPFRSGSRSRVAIVRGEEVPRMVKKAVDLIGGMAKLEVAGSRTVVKPNVVWGDPPPATTDPRVVSAVASLAKNERPASLAVGDMSAVVSLPTRPHLEKTGIAEAARKVGAEVLAFEEGEWVEVHPPHVEYAKTVYVAKAAYEADRLISVPVIKTHRSASFSCALKNTVGCVHGKNKPWVYGSDGWEPAVAELNMAVRPDLFVVDGLQAMVRGGPWSGEAVPTRIILASGDPIATDVVALGIIKAFGRWEMVSTKGVWEQVQIRRGIALGLGAAGPDDVELIAEDLTGGDPNFAKLVDDIRRYVGLR
ncbi:MAG: DUF362 domain-containing protein [Candidatus Methylomirabilales bacterium]